MTVLSAMRGAALEPCFKEVVVALHESRDPQQPVQFYFKAPGQARGQLYGDVDILNAMWKLAGRLREVLERHGFALRWAQSTYKRNDRRHATRGSAFTVDLTVRRGGKTFWLEVKYTDDPTLGAGISEAEKGLKKFAEAKENASVWSLVEALGGWPMVAPAACGYFVCGPSSYNFNLPGECVVQAAWDDHRAMTPLRSQAMRRYKKASRQKATRQQTKQRLSAVPLVTETGQQRAVATTRAQDALVLKRPASVLKQPAREVSLWRGSFYCCLQLATPRRSTWQ